MSHAERNLACDELRIAIVRKKIGCEIRFYGVRGADGTSALLGKTCQNDALTIMLVRALEEGCKMNRVSFLKMGADEITQTGGR